MNFREARLFGILVTTFHLLVCVFLILLVLLQQGKGADTGATFGGGGQTLFGATGADTLLTKVTTVCALFFMTTSIYLSAKAGKLAVNEGNLFQNVQQEGSPEGSETASPSPSTAESPSADTTGKPTNTASPETPEEPSATAPTEPSSVAPASPASTPPDSGAAVTPEQQPVAESQP